MPSGRARVFPALLRFVQGERWGRSPFRLCRNGLRPCPAPAEKRNRKNRPCVYRVLSAVIEVLNKKLFVANAECNGQGFYFIGIEMALTNLDFG